MSNVKLYRKKPVVVEVMQVGVDSYKSITAWSGATQVKGGNLVVWLSIPTLEGKMRAEIGDYIIKGVKGEFYSCKPDIFNETYELAA